MKEKRIPIFPVYYCTNCREIAAESREGPLLLYVEDRQDRGFCSEECIEEFFSPLVDSFSEYFDSQIDPQDIAKKEGRDPEKVESLLSTPDEIYFYETLMRERFFFYIKHFDGFFMAAVSFVFDRRPSFVFFHEAYHKEEHCDLFRKGEKLSPKVLEEYLKSAQNLNLAVEEERGELHESEEFIELDNEKIEALEQKKSVILAELIEKRKNSDIEIEKYPLYQEFLAPTLKDADEIFNFSGDEQFAGIHTYVKAFEQEGTSFYYIALVHHVEEDLESRTRALFPIFSFPTLDPDLYRFFCRGEAILGHVKN